MASLLFAGHGNNYTDEGCDLAEGNGIY